MRFHTDYSQLPDNSNPNRYPCTKAHEVGKDFRKRENGGRDDYQWSGNQLDQEEWWIGNFKFPPTQIILLNWY